jgi:hypothetical protein
MGWTFTLGATKDDVVGELLDGSSTLDHELRGDVLWAVVEFDHQRVIACFLLQDNGDGWGYKDMDESMHPPHYDCPLRLLEITPVTCEEWRAGVHAFHARKYS